LGTALLIVHSLVAVALLGAITHQTLATWVPARARSGSLFSRFRSVPSASFPNAIVILYSVAALLGAVVYGWVPLLIGAMVMVVMLTWRKEREFWARKRGVWKHRSTASAG